MGLPGSGATTIVYNTRERVVSTDPNRAQAINAKQIADVLRFMLEASNEEDVSGGGVETAALGAEVPMHGVILNGIRPRPEVGTANLFIERGVAVLVDNANPSIDDSVAAYVDDPGVDTLGQLVLTAGAGSTRIDVVECQRSTEVLESDNRDIFNVSTGLFTPTQVTKVQGGRLVYRIRTGTPGAGFPGVASGWLPLMVASVPAAATTWDDCICWDVRPLASDRTNGPFKTTRLWDWTKRSLVAVDATTNVNQVRLSGEVDLSFGGYKAGGVLRKNSATAYIDITDSDNQAAGFAGFGTVTGSLWYLYLVFPFGLPRWVRYTNNSGIWAPGTQRGIPAVSGNPCNFDGKPRAANVQTPTVLGLQDPGSQNAIVALAGRGPKAGGTVPFGCHADGKQHMLVNPDAFTVAASTNTSSLARWAFNDQNSVPGNARAMWLRLHASFQFPTPAAGAQGVGTVLTQVTVSDMAGNDSSQAAVGIEGDAITHVDSDPGGMGATPGVLFVREFVVRIPLQPTFLLNTNRVIHVTWTHSSSLTATAPVATVIGWELGP